MGVVGRDRTGRLCREGGRRHDFVSNRRESRGGLYEVLEQVDHTQECNNPYMFNSKRVRHGYKIHVLSRREIN